MPVVHEKGKVTANDLSPKGFRKKSGAKNTFKKRHPYLSTEELKECLKKLDSRSNIVNGYKAAIRASIKVMLRHLADEDPIISGKMALNVLKADRYIGAPQMAQLRSPIEKQYYQLYTLFMHVFQKMRHKMDYFDKRFEMIGMNPTEKKDAVDEIKEELDVLAEELAKKKVKVKGMTEKEMADDEVTFETDFRDGDFRV